MIHLVKSFILVRADLNNLIVFKMACICEACIGVYRDTGYLPFYFQGYRILSIFSCRDMGYCAKYFRYFQGY